MNFLAVQAFVSFGNCRRPKKRPVGHRRPYRSLRRRAEIDQQRNALRASMLHTAVAWFGGLHPRIPQNSPRLGELGGASKGFIWDETEEVCRPKLPGRGVGCCEYLLFSCYLLFRLPSFFGVGWGPGLEGLGLMPQASEQRA